jgi:uncharacterized protein YbaP (TraB family)
MRPIIAAVAILATGLLGAQSLENTMLWRLERANMPHAYLFGTIHVLPQNEFKMPQKVVDALKDSKKLVMELDFSNPRMQEEMMEGSLMSDGSTLDAYFSPHEFDQLGAVLKATSGIPIEMVKSYKPFVLSTMLIGRFIDGPPASFELSLLQMAAKEGLTVGGLETIAEQLAIFDRIPYQKQADDLRDLLNNEEQRRSLYASMVAMYRKESPDELLSVLMREIPDAEEQNALVFDRNALWIDRIHQLTAEDPVFIAVGAGHLAGPRGLISLLGRSGFEVIPIMD